jgi:tetratricopeptide (TPR) repeat protein
MKQIIFSVLLAFLAVTSGFGQDLKKAKSYLDAKQLDKAKTEIDAFVAKSPSDPEGNYMQAKIYEQIAAADSGQSKMQEASDARQQAFEAFKKAMADTSNTKMTLMALKDQYQPIFSLYTGYYEAGANAFNAAAVAGDKAGFSRAMDYFIKANDVGQYIARNKWSKIPDVDTTLVLNIAKSALNAGKNDTAKIYFLKLADAGITGTKDGGANNSAFELPYQWLTLNYKEAKDEANMLKYANLGKKLFPNESYFDLVLIDYYREKKDNAKLFAKYDDLIAKNPDSLMYHFNYANDIFGYIYNGDAGVTVTNKDSLMKTLQEQLEKAHSLNPDNVVTNWLYAQYYYNKGIDSRDEALKIKSTKPDDVKKKADLNAEAKSNFNKAVPYGEKALATLEAGAKKSDKSRYKSIADLMQKIYQSMNQNDKVKVYQAKYDGADAKFVN